MKRNIVRAKFSVGLLGAVVIGALLFPLGAAGFGVASMNLVTPPAGNNYKLGATVAWTSSIGFTANESKTLLAASVDMTGPQACDATVPTEIVSMQLVSCTPASSGFLTVTVTHTNVTKVGNIFTAGPDGGSINYSINWKSPVLLNPAPTITLLPNTSKLFDIPVIPTPAAETNPVQALPQLTQKFPIPDLNALGLIPTPEAGLPSPLPAIAQAFDVPLIPQPSAEGGLADLPDVTEAFTVPVLPTPTPVAGVSELPAADLAWAIPTIATPTPVLGAGNDLPNHTSAFTIPSVSAATQSGRGITTDGTDFFLILDDDGSEATPKDKIVKVNSSGALVSAFGTGGVVAGDSNDLGGIAYATVSGVATLFVWNNDTNNSSAVRKYNPTNGDLIGSIARSTINNIPNLNNMRVADIGAEGNKLWVIREDGCYVVQIGATGALVSGQEFYPQCAFKGGLAVKGTGTDVELFFAGASDVLKYVKSGSQIQQQGETYTLTNLDDIQGLVQSGGVLYIVDSFATSVRKSGIPHGIEIEGTPKGITADPDGIHVWVAIDATPKDIIAKVVASSGSLVTSFDAQTAGVTDLTYLSGFLYAAERSGNNQPTIRKIDPATGLQSASITPEQFYSTIGGMGNNGTNLIGTADDSFNQCTYEINKTTGAQNGVCIQRSFNGGTALTRRTSDSTYFVAKNNQIDQLNSSRDTRLQAITLNDGNLVIEGMSFVGDVLYLASSGDNQVYKASIPHGISISQDPLGMAYDGTHLWLLIDGTPRDYIAKVTTTGTLVTSFQAPSANTSAIAYMAVSGSPFLWIAQNESQFGSPTIKKINPSTGAEVGTISPQNAFGVLGGLDTDGTRLVGIRDDFIEGWFISTNGSTERFQPFDVIQGLNGGDALVRRASDGKYFIGKNNRIQQFDSGIQRGLQNFQINEPPIGIQGMAFVGSALYMADRENDKVYKAAVPTGIEVTTDPLGLAYDQAGGSLYILIDATPLDKIAKVHPTTGYFYQAFEVGSAGAEGITFFDNNLWVAERSGFSSPTIRKINPATGQEVASISPQNVFENIGGLANDGTQIIAGRASTGFFSSVCFWEVNKSNGTSEQHCPFVPQSLIDGVDGLERTATGEYLAAQDSKVVKFDSGLEFPLDDWTTAIPTEIVGMSLVGNTVLIADTLNDKIYKTSLPSGFSVGTEPLGLAYNGTNLFALIDATPLDKVLELIPTTGTLVRRFSAPDDDAEDIAYLDGALYIAVNDNDRGQQGSRAIHKVNPTDGASLGTLNSLPFDIYSDLVGLGKHGEHLVTTQKDGNQIFFLSSIDGHSERTLYPPFDVPNGLRDVALLEGEGLFGVKGDGLFRIDEEGGFLIQQFDNLQTGSFQLDGITGVGNLLYFADKVTDAIYVASIPQPPLDITRTPKGMTGDGADLFIVVDASPKDKIIKVNTAGQLVTSFGTGGVIDAPSNNTDAIDFFNGDLWVLTTDPAPGCPQCLEPSKLRKLDASTGAQLTTIEFRNLGFFDVFYALTNDGSKLIAGAQDGSWVMIDPTNPQGASRINQMSAEFPYMHQFGSMQFINTAGIGLWGVSGNLFNKFNKSTGLTLKSMNLQGVEDASGLAYVGTTLYIADEVGDTGSIGEVRGSTFVENRPEFTAAGAYTSRLSVMHGEGTDNGTASSFNLVKVTEVNVNITSPNDDAVVEDTSVNVQGTVDDPSITKVLLGGEAGVQTVFQTNANDPNAVPSNVSIQPATGEVRWHIDTNSIANTPPGAWHYARNVQGAGDYDTPGAANSGSLIIGNLGINEGARLAFQTWYNTEGHPEADKKLIEVNIVGDVPDRGWQALAQIVAPGSFGTSPANALEEFQFIYVQPAQREFIPPQNCPPDCSPQFREIWQVVDVPLEQFAGRALDVRFKFDTVNAVFNTFEGWYVDDIVVRAKGAVPSANVAGDGTFSATFNLNEGSNTLGVSAVNGYTFPALTGQDSVRVFRDTLPPLVNILQDVVNQGTLNDPNPDVITPSGQYQISGSFVESKFSTMLVTNQVGGVEIPILTVVGTPPANNAFSQNVTLFDGENRVKVTVTDTAGRQGAAEALILRDAQGPIVTVLDAVYTVGVVSARQGDPIIFQLNAIDALSNVRCVEVIMPGPGSDPPPCASLDPEFVPSQNMREAAPFQRPEEIPQAVRDTWGTTGQWLLPLLIPDGTLPGSFDLQIRATDLGNNTSPASVRATVVPSLSAINIGLMPNAEYSDDPSKRIGANLVSLPLIPTDSGDGNLVRLLGKPTNVSTLVAKDDFDAALSMDGTKLVFVSDRARPGFSDIFVRNQGTGVVTQLTSEGNNLTPNWSPNGAKIVFVSDRDSTDDQFDVFVMNADGSGQARLTNSIANAADYDNFDPVFTPDGAGILWASDQGMDHFMIWRMDVDGTDQGAISGHAAAGMGHFAPRPSSGQVLYVSDEEGNGFFDVFAMNADGTNPHKVIDRKVTFPSPASWRPTGGWIGFVDRPGGGTTPANVFARRESDGKVVQVSYAPAGGVTDDTWTNWGTDDRIYFDQAMGDSFFDIFTVEPRMFLLTEAIWYYDATKTNMAVEDRWSVFTPGPAPDSLNKLETGRGYWWLTDSAEFEFSAALDTGLPQTPKVENLNYKGVFLRSGAEAPPTYQVKTGWNLIGLHGERAVLARDYLAALGRGDQAAWSSLLRYDNFIEFPIGVEDAEPRFELGHFTGIFDGADQSDEANLMKPTQGFWLFSTKDGSYTPQGGR